LDLDAILLELLLKESGVFERDRNRIVRRPVDLDFRDLLLRGCDGRQQGTESERQRSPRERFARKRHGKRSPPFVDRKTLRA
jgi:hypothetical protein